MPMPRIANVPTKPIPIEIAAAERGAGDQVAAELVGAERVLQLGSRYACEKSTSYGSYGEKIGAKTTYRHDQRGT